MSELNKYEKILELDKVLERLSDCAITELGKRRCLNCENLKTKEKIETALNFTTEARKIYDTAGDFSIFPLEFIADCDEILKNNKLKVEEIYECIKTLRNSRLVRNFLLNEAEVLKVFSDRLYTNKELEDEVFKIILPDMEISDDGSLELKRLRASKRDCENNLKDKITKLLGDSVFSSHLQDSISTTRNGRVVFQVKASDKSKIKGIVHDVSSSGQTFFIEPNEIIPLGNKLQQLESEINTEIERIISELSEKCHEIQDDLIMIENALVELDFIFAKAKYSIKTKSTPAVLIDKKEIKLQGARHPLLIGIVDNIIENDIEIGENYKTLIITGSNTGGKTVMLKTVGLLTLMMMRGMHIPCHYAEIYPFSNVLADISQDQDILKNLSTFSANITNVRGILEDVNDKSLVLFDELCSGTDPREGAALAQSILESLKNQGALTLITTHLGELKLLEYKDSDFKNGSVEFDIKTLKPTYKFIIGVAGSSNALEISKNLNIKEDIINRAREILSDGNVQNDEILNKIQKTHLELSEETKTAAIERSEAQELKREYEKKLKDLKESKKKVLESFKNKYQKSIESAREEVKTALDDLRKEKTESVARRVYSRLAKIESEALYGVNQDKNELNSDYKDINWEKIKIGDSVLIRDIEQVGILNSYPDKKGNVEIQLGLIKTSVNIKKLAQTEKKAKIKQRKKDFIMKHYEPVSSTLDLRGMRVEEAIDKLEIHLDLASLRGLNELTIIHGHGTGALKSAVREYLSSSPYISKFRAGDRLEGQDGVTIVNLK